MRNITRWTSQYSVRIFPEHIDSVSQCKWSLYSSDFGPPCRHPPLSWQSCQKSTSVWSIFHSLSVNMNESQFFMINQSSGSLHPWQNHEIINERLLFLFKYVRCTMLWLTVPCYAAPTWVCRPELRRCISEGERRIMGRPVRSCEKSASHWTIYEERIEAIMRKRYHIPYDFTVKIEQHYN